MTPADDHRHFEEELAAYVIGNLEGADRIAFEAHLDQCERCRRDHDRLAPAAGVLAASVPQLDPPRRLRRRTLAAARSQWATGEGARRQPLGVPQRAALAAGLAAVVAAVAIAVGSLGGEGSNRTSTVAVQPTDARAAKVAGELVVRDDTATLEVARMPRLPASQVYEAWTQRDGEIAPSGTFIVDRNGLGATTIPDLRDADRVMVTREPRGGSQQPTTAPLLQAVL